MTGEEMPVTAAGAAVGGILGYQLGGGVILNSLFATAGTVAGGSAGFYATRALRESDRAAYDRTAQKGLASAEDGKILDWQNPETGNSGIFRATHSLYMVIGATANIAASTAPPWPSKRKSSPSTAWLASRPTENGRSFPTTSAARVRDRLRVPQDIIL